MNLVDPHAAAEAHALARAGDRDAMDRLITMFSRWVASKVRNPPRMVDPDDAESFAMESVWIAARKCDTPIPIVSFAAQTFRFKVANHRQQISRRPKTKNYEGWSNVSGSEVSFPSPVPLNVKECERCGTTGGYTAAGRKSPRRTKGLCDVCDRKRRWEEKAK